MSTTIKGTGLVVGTDYKTIKWSGKTKAGAAIEITLNNAINMGNIDWTMAEKDDVVSAITFTATYSNTDAASTSTEEPWSITSASDITPGAGEIVLGAGIFSIDNTPIALTRGGGSFNVTREYRRINADGDRGPVKDRIIMEGSEATLTMNVLTMLTSIADLYPAISQ